MLRVLELFAGIGACSKALTNLGIEHEIVDAVEIDKYAVNVMTGEWQGQHVTVLCDGCHQKWEAKVNRIRSMR